ncbi:MAG: ATP-dependent helicase [Flavitalea sp.]
MNNREKLNQRFQEEYARLNEHQRIAVDKIEGPVMVIAGPGTGKTQILAARIGKILLDTDASPSNILCLTYTDAGSLAMRKRLLHFIGPDAYKVNIYTFHAFCNDIIQENLSLFEKNILDPISDLERIELLKKLIDDFPKNHPLKRYRGDVYYEMNGLTNLFSTMKREGWKPAYILERIEEYMNDLPNRSEFIYQKAYRQFKKGDLKINKIEEERERMTKLSAAVNEFEKFQQLMRDRNRYDFNDMINWVIEAFENNPNLIADYQERYQYILVDEFQDTSGTQNKLVNLLIGFWEHPNVFVVGDDDQSIYRFQGANIENMESFAKSYSEDLMTIVLTNNYRSTQPILDISKSLIDRNSERLIKKLKDFSKDLTSSHPEISLLKNLPTFLSYESQRDEMVDIVLRIEQLIAEGIDPGHIAVIYKENKYGEELMRMMRYKNIPTYSKRNVNLFEIPLARKIIHIIRYLAAEHDIPYGGEEMLFELLHFDFWKIPPMEIAKLSIEVADKGHKGERSSIRRTLYDRSNAPAKDLFDTGIHPGMKRASITMESLISDLPNVTLQNLVEMIIRKTGILNQIMLSPDKIWLMQVLVAFFDFVKEETRRDPLMTAEQFITTIDLMESNDVAIPLAQVAGSDKGVNLLTVHGSKGLEFEYVFFTGCVSKVWEKKKTRSGGFSFPDTMFDSKAISNDDEELRRLFYVALTRAQKHLFITYSNCGNDGKGYEPSQFIAEIRDSHVIEVEEVKLNKSVTMEFEAIQFMDTASPEIEKIEADFIQRFLDKFVMNVTALSNYLRCPLQFYYNNLIRIPSPKNENTEFGSAVHYAIQRLFEKMQQDPANKFPSKEEMLRDFDWYMHRHRESFTREAFKRRMEYGVEVLANYYDKYLTEWNKVVAVERNIRNVVWNGVPLKGKLDKLEFNNKEVNVVDYKTGDFEKAKKKFHPPNDKDPNGGDYWRQAVFYKILVDNYEQKEWRVISTEFDFIEPDNKKVYQKRKVVISPEDITTVTQQITDTWQKIQNKEFYIGCGKEDCHYCNFVKENNLHVALHEVEVDVLEEE